MVVLEPTLRVTPDAGEPVAVERPHIFGKDGTFGAYLWGPWASDSVTKFVDAFGTSIAAPCTVSAARFDVIPLVIAGALAGCSGQVTGSSDESLQDGPQEGLQEPEQGIATRPPAADPVEPSKPEDFSLPQDQVALLPFEIRMDKLSHVVGVPPDDPIFSELHQRRTDLGGADYAAGYLPSNAWTADRMTTWIDGLQSVCGSSAFQGRYPNLEQDLQSLLEIAYGRDISPHELEDFSVGLGSESNQRVLCLSVLSSGEFVLR